MVKNPELSTSQKRAEVIFGNLHNKVNVKVALEKIKLFNKFIMVCKSGSNYQQFSRYTTEEHNGTIEMFRFDAENSIHIPFEVKLLYDVTLIRSIICLKFK